MSENVYDKNASGCFQLGRDFNGSHLEGGQKEDVPYRITHADWERILVLEKQVREMHLFIAGVKAALLANPMVRAMVPADVLKELSGE